MHWSLFLSALFSVFFSFFLASSSSLPSLSLYIPSYATSFLSLLIPINSHHCHLPFSVYSPPFTSFSFFFFFTNLTTHPSPLSRYRHSFLSLALICYKCFFYPPFPFVIVSFPSLPLALLLLLIHFSLLFNHHSPYLIHPSSRRFCVPPPRLCHSTFPSLPLALVFPLFIFCPFIPHVTRLSMSPAVHFTSIVLLFLFFCVCKLSSSWPSLTHFFSLCFSSCYFFILHVQRISCLTHALSLPLCPTLIFFTIVFPPLAL